MRPAHHFTVVSSIPDSLATMPALAANLHWSWDRQLASLFDRLDGGLDGSWRDTGQHPVDLVRRTTPACWETLADDAEFVDQVAQAQARLDNAMHGETWFGNRREAGDSPLDLVAYFSPEFGITEALPQYSGGLGVLAGDHLKASSDLGVPLVAVGLLYAEGYFHQELNGDGWQQERNERLDPIALGLRQTGVMVTVDLAGVEARVQVWRADVGRVPLYLLDTNVPENPPEVIAVTDRLYGGDEQHRIRQEITLGIGGVRALRALDIHPQVFHMNEGHAGFLGLERVREWIERGFSFDEAVETVRAGGVFTTHTPVPAGIDRFPLELFEQYFESFAESCGVTFSELHALGERADEPDGKFNMAVMGMRLAARRNGVARLHGDVSREMFSGMWPELPAADTPISHVTNGVHARTWVSDRVDELFTNVMGDWWHLAGPDNWGGVHDLDHQDIWQVRRAGREELVDMVRSELGGHLLDPDVLTVGFARRFATYKRANLLLGQLDRLRAMLLDAERPVQFVFAGKAHPADHPGKTLIQEIRQLATEADVQHRFVFIPDYDIGIARTMYHGCDVWLNTPRRPMEACGTSGMKAALNGVLNCSIRDGWWDEMSNGENGWDIPSFDRDTDDVRRDLREATATFNLFERSIVPLFYDRGTDDLPHGWIDRIVRNWASLGWNVIAGRMVRDYVTTLYEPAAGSATALTADDGTLAREVAAWKSTVRAAWPEVAVDLLDTDSSVGDGVSDNERRAEALVRPGPLSFDELVVQLIHGPLHSDGTYDEHELRAVDLQHEGDGRYTGSFVTAGAGPWGATARAMPVHPGLTSVFDTGLVASG